MIGVYFSGTGNSKYCLEEFISQYDNSAEVIDLEDSHATEKIQLHSDILFAYPIYFSDIPKIVRDFIENNHLLWKGKNIFIIATMGLFSGDGAGLSARLFRKYGADIIGGVHIKMPDNICDINLLKRSDQKNSEILTMAGQKIKQAVIQCQAQNPPQEGLNGLYHMAGLFGQRLWAFGKARHYYKKVKIDTHTCIGCGLCTNICPMNNLYLSEHKAYAHERCTLCYRCANQCPKKAITILGKRVISQYSIKKFI